MNTLKIFTLMCAGLGSSGCMATVTPDGVVTAEYIVPAPAIVVEHYPHYVPFLPPVVHRHPPRSYAPRLVPINPHPPHIARGPSVRVPYAPQQHHGGKVPSARAPQQHGGSVPSARTPQHRGGNPSSAHAPQHRGRR